MTSQKTALMEISRRYLPKAAFFVVCTPPWFVRVAREINPRGGCYLLLISYGITSPSLAQFPGD